MVTHIDNMDTAHPTDVIAEDPTLLSAHEYSHSDLLAQDKVRLLAHLASNGGSVALKDMVEEWAPLMRLTASKLGILLDASMREVTSNELGRTISLVEPAGPAGQ